MIERILYNAQIVTLNPAQPRATALAIGGGRILAVGDDDTIRALAGADTVLEDVEGRPIIPGLTDAHIHWEGVAHSLAHVDVFEVPSKDEALRRVAERAQRTPPGEWIVGQGWSQAYWADSSFPTAADLDTVAPHHPVYLSAKSGHAAWVNSAALRAAGLTANTPDPPGAYHPNLHGAPSPFQPVRIRAGHVAISESRRADGRRTAPAHGNSAQIGRSAPDAIVPAR